MAYLICGLVLVQLVIFTCTEAANRLIWALGKDVALIALGIEICTYWKRFDASNQTILPRHFTTTKAECLILTQFKSTRHFYAAQVLKANFSNKQCSLPPPTQLPQSPIQLLDEALRLGEIGSHEPQIPKPPARAVGL